MISIVIRNKNEAKALENILSILTKVYFGDYQEIIIIDNNSLDNSIEVAQKFGCRIITITDFSYGRATNLGIEHSISNYVLLLSSHAIPVGNSFFKNTISAISSSSNIAGIRFINSIENYQRAIRNNFEVNEPLKYGLMTGCAMINKEVWYKYKFDETLKFNEDKEWSQRVFEKGYSILDLNETFFYFIKRNNKSSLQRYKHEIISKFQIEKVAPKSNVKAVFLFLKKAVLINTKNFLITLWYDFSILLINFQINKLINKKNVK